MKYVYVDRVQTINKVGESENSVPPLNAKFVLEGWNQARAKKFCEEVSRYLQQQEVHLG